MTSTLASGLSSFGSIITHITRYRTLDTLDLVNCMDAFLLASEGLEG